MGDQIRKVWDKNVVVVCMVLAVMLGIAFGMSLGSIKNQEQVLGMQESQRKERNVLTRNHLAEKKYLRGQLAERNDTIARQSDQLAELATKAADGNKAAMRLMDKQAPKATTK